jgi:hypothetical protein
MHGEAGGKERSLALSLIGYFDTGRCPPVAALNYGECRPILQTRKVAAQAIENNNFGE